MLKSPLEHDATLGIKGVSFGFDIAGEVELQLEL